MSLRKRNPSLMILNLVLDLLNFSRRNFKERRVDKDSHRVRNGVPQDFSQEPRGD